MALFDTDDSQFNEILNRLIKISEVSSINPAAGTARVVFDDDDSVVSYDLPVLQRNTIANRDYAMPDIGEDVLCIFLPSGPEDGFVLGSFYADEISPPESSGDKRTVVFSDDTRISYDRATHELSITIGGTSVVANGDSIAAATPQEISAKAGTTVNIEGGATVNINGGSAVNIGAPVLTLTMGATVMKLTGSSATITSSNLVLNGNITVTGNLDVTGNVTATGPVHGANI